MTLSVNSIEQSYSQLKITRAELFDAHEAMRKAEIALEDSRSMIIVATPPKELGANEEQRQAKLIDLTSKETKALRESQALERVRRLALEMAQDDVRLCGALLQFIASTTTPAQNDHHEALVEF